MRRCRFLNQKLKLAALAIALCTSSPSWSQERGSDDQAGSASKGYSSSQSKGSAQGLAPGQAPQDDDFFPPAPEVPVRRKVFSPAERKAICDKYQGRLVAFYNDVYKVESCKRRMIVNSKTVYNMMREGQEVIDIDSDVMVALPEGSPIDLAVNAQGARGCKELEGMYVSYSATDVYFVEKCNKRIFPDWATYVDHRQKRGDGRGEILSLNWLEFSQLPAGRAIPSIIDDMFAKLLRGDGSTDIIPVDEACAGLEGKVVAFYSRLYRVEKCRKREFTDPEAFMLKTGVERAKIPDLTAQIWLSLPDGPPIKDYKKYPDAPAEAPKTFGRKTTL
jgi:hypothetical protein